MRDRVGGPRRTLWHPSLVVGWVVGLTLLGAGCGAPSPDATLQFALMDAEDARGTGPSGLAPILEGLSSPNPELQLLAVRALGRFENPEHIELISALLGSTDPTVRVEAVNALGQAVFQEEGQSVERRLIEHLSQEGESDPDVMGAIGRTLGRISYRSPAQPGQLDEIQTVLLGLTQQDDEDAPLPRLLGSVMGLESFVRQNRGVVPLEPVVERLKELTSYGLSVVHGGPEDAPRVRRVALMALMAAGQIEEVTIQGALGDPDPDMRRLGVAAIRRNPDMSGVIPALEFALGDPSPRVRAQVVTTFAAIAPEDQKCDMLQRAASDSHPQVALTALDLLGQPCPDIAQQIQILEDFAEAPESRSPTLWHRGAHALVALSRVSPTSAVPLLPDFASHVSPFARVYAAQAAAEIGDENILDGLAGDDVPNVRNAAVDGLFRLRGHDVDEVLLAQLTQDDPQLLLTVAGLLEGTPNPERVVTPLRETLHRISADGRETMRDPRIGIINRLSEVAGVAAPEVLGEYLSDYDPGVATLVAEILTAKTGVPTQASPNPAPRVPFPSLDELDRLAQVRVVLEMEGGGQIEIRLFPYMAPTNAARFAHLAEAGVLDGLTFHRVVSNFVVQGLSPNANEMAGHGPFTRDELGLQSNWRGTIGTSTRGRDTGDGQIYFNSVDNLRLDHNYTVFGEVVAGMEVVDDIVEGQVVLRARVVGP